MTVGKLPVASDREEHCVRFIVLVAPMVGMTVTKDQKRTKFDLPRPTCISGDHSTSRGTTDRMNRT